MKSSVRHHPGRGFTEHNPSGCFLVCASLGDVKGRWEPWPSPVPVQRFLWLLEKSRKRRRKRGTQAIDHTRKHKTEQKCHIELMSLQSFGGRSQGNCSLYKLHQAEFPQTPFHASQHLQRPFPALPSCSKLAVIHRVSCPTASELPRLRQITMQGRWSGPNLRATSGSCVGNEPGSGNRKGNNPVQRSQLRPRNVASGAEQRPLESPPERTARSPACTGILRTANGPSTPNAACDPDSAPPRTEKSLG